MTGLTFLDCKVKKHLIQLNSKSTSISHICLSNLQKNADDGDKQALFLYIETHRFSFLKIVYSTLVGPSEKLEKVLRMIYLHGTCSFKLQCLNISKYKLDSSRSRFIVYITSPSCLNMLMNTFSNLDSENILKVCDQDQNKTHAIYIATNNFVDYMFLSINHIFRLYHWQQ